MTKRTTLAVPYVTPQLFANVVITAMHKLQKASKSFFTTQGPEIRDNRIIIIYTSGLFTPNFLTLSIQSLQLGINYIPFIKEIAQMCSY